MKRDATIRVFFLLVVLAVQASLTVDAGAITPHSPENWQPGSTGMQLSGDDQDPPRTSTCVLDQSSYRL